MQTSEPKVTLSAAVPIELKERLKRIGTLKRWTLSQTVVLLLEDCLEEWERQVGVESQVIKPKRTKSKS